MGQQQTDAAEHIDSGDGCPPSAPPWQELLFQPAGRLEVEEFFPALRAHFKVEVCNCRTLSPNGNLHWHGPPADAPTPAGRTPANCHGLSLHCPREPAVPETADSWQQAERAESRDSDGGRQQGSPVIGRPQEPRDRAGSCGVNAAFTRPAQAARGFTSRSMVFPASISATRNS